MLNRFVFVLALLLAGSANAFEVCDAAKDPTAYAASDRWAVIAEQGKDGWIFAKGELLEPAALGSSVSTLSRMAKALRAKGVLPVLLAVPNRLTLAEDKIDSAKPEFGNYQKGGMVKMYARHMAQLAKTGWEALNLVQVGKDSGLGAEFFNDKDHHWSTEGSRVTADAIAAVVKKNVQLTPKEYKLETSKVRNPGSYRWVVLDRCGIDIPAEETNSYKAVSSEEVSADALLGDAPPAEVVLIGTSQSRRQDFDAIANRQYFEDSFSALLRNALQADVLNLAAAGGGTFTSVDGFLTSREFQKNKPKVMIWEMNDSEGFEQAGMLRSLVPAVHGRCKKSEALATASGSGDDPVELIVPADVKAAGTDYYLALKLSDSSITDFKITFDHGSKTDGVAMKRSPLLPNSGLFFSELNDAIPAPLKSVKVALPKGSDGRWDARLCKAE